MSNFQTVVTVLAKDGRRVDQFTTTEACDEPRAREIHKRFPGGKVLAQMFGPLAYQVAAA